MIRPLLLLALFLWAGLPAAPAADAPPQLPLPDAGQVIRRFVERAAISESNRLGGAYMFYRTNITEEFSRQGERTKHEVLRLRVTIAHQAQRIELLEINGRTPTASETEQQLKRFGQHTEKATSREKPDRSRQMENFITMEVLGRYVFAVHGRDNINGRSCLMVTFQPSAGLSDSGKLFERVLDHMGGMLWIDEKDYELLKADIHLRDRVSLWGGFLGALDQMHLKILRDREPDGRWRDREVEARFVGRALTHHIDVETRDYSSAAEPIPQVPVMAAQ